MPEAPEQLLSQALQDLGAGILHPVFAVAETHDLLLAGDRPVEPGLHLIERADLLEHVEHILVGTAVQRAGQGADRRGHHRVGIGEGAGGDAGAEGAGVEAVLGVQDQAGIEDAGRQGIGLPLGEHVEEVRGVGEVVAGLDRVVAVADQLEGRHHRGDLGDQAHHRLGDVLGIVEGAAGIEQAQRGGARLQRIHRMAAGREALHHVADAEAHPPVPLHIPLELPQLEDVGQLTPDQQVGRLQEAALGGQLIHRVAPVAEHPFLAVDVADRRLGGRHPLKTGPIGNRSPIRSAQRGGLGSHTVSVNPPNLGVRPTRCRSGRCHDSGAAAAMTPALPLVLRASLIGSPAAAAG